MPQPKPEPGQEPQTLSFSIPTPMAERIRAEFPSRYGGQTAWFRKVVQHWWDTRDLRAELDRERAMRIRVEQALRKVQVAVHEL